MDLEDERLALDTGCWETGHYHVRGLPAPDECELIVTGTVRGEDELPRIDPPAELDLCRTSSNFSREGPKGH